MYLHIYIHASCLLQWSDMGFLIVFCVSVFGCIQLHEDEEE